MRGRHVGTAEGCEDVLGAAPRGALDQQPRPAPLAGVGHGDEVAYQAREVSGVRSSWLTLSGNPPCNWRTLRSVMLRMASTAAAGPLLAGQQIDAQGRGQNLKPARRTGR